MKKLFAFLLILSGLFMVAIAFAQPQIGDDVEWGNLPAYFQSPELLAIVVFATVGLLKKHVLKSLEDLASLLLSFGVGAGLGILGSVTGWSDVALVPGIVLGVSAAYLASGGFDGLRGLLGKRGSD